MIIWLPNSSQKIVNDTEWAFRGHGNIRPSLP